jgi:asparagine synthase (glutamine-hydrolysing)
LRPILMDAVSSHLIADVPVGLFLSSGLDSGAVAALASRARPGVQSFTVTFPGTQLDESELARLVAKHCLTKHSELPLNGKDALAGLAGAIAALDQPTMDAVNTYFVSWAAREVGLKVALSGLGGDELFAGYATFAVVPRLAKLVHAAWFVPSVLRRAVSPVLSLLLKLSIAPDAVQKVNSAWNSPDALPHPYYFARTLFPPGRIEQLIEPRYRPSSVGADGVTLEPTWLGWLQRCADEAKKFDPAGGISWLEMRTYMASTLLRDTDSVSMAQSLEVRVPLLDTPLVEFINALGDGVKLRSGVQKALLAEAVGEMLPKEILTQSKRTFTLPWEEWLRGPLRERVESSLRELAPALQPYMNPGGLQKVWADFLAGKTSWSRPWALYVLNEWCRQL